MTPITNEMIFDELCKMKNRISELEAMLGCNKISEKSKKKLTKPIGLSKDVLNIILVEPDDDIPRGYDSLLVILDEGYGELINILTNELERFCEDILKGSEGDKIVFPEYTMTNKYAILNGEGDWEIQQREVQTLLEE